MSVPSPSTGGSRVRLLMLVPVAVAVAILTLFVGGAGAHTGAAVAQRLTASGPPDQPIVCDPGYAALCLAAVSYPDLASVLERDGFKCSAGQGGTIDGRPSGIATCQLTIGTTQYSAELSYEGEKLSSVLASVTKGIASTPNAHPQEYLTWFAEMPFPESPSSRSAAGAWFEQRFADGDTAQARINGYEYKASPESGGAYQIEIDAGLEG